MPLGLCPERSKTINTLAFLGGLNLTEWMQRLFTVARSTSVIVFDDRSPKNLTIMPPLTNTVRLTIELAMSIPLSLSHASTFSKDCHGLHSDNGKLSS